MTIPTRTGTAAQVDASGGNGSTTVTVPADCNLIVAMWCHFDLNGSSTLSSLTLNGVGFTIQEQLAEGATTDENGGGVATLVNPATGSQTFAWTWSAGGARLEGGEIVLIFVKDANTSDPVRDTAIDSAASVVSVSVTLTTTTDDLVLGFGEAWGGNVDLSGAGRTVFIDNWQPNGHNVDVIEATPGASTTDIDWSNYHSYSTAIGIALKPSPITFRTSSTAQVGAGNADITVDKPTGVVEGDLLIAVFVVYDITSASATPPSGFNLITSGQTSSSRIEVWAYYKIAGGSEPASYTFTSSSSNYKDVMIARYDGNDGTTPIATSVSNNTGVSTTRTGLTITPTVDQSGLCLVSIGYNSAPSTTPTGMTQRVSWDTVNRFYDEMISLAAATGDRTQTVTSDDWVTLMFAIQPPFTPGGGPSPLMFIIHQ